MLQRVVCAPATLPSIKYWIYRGFFVRPTSCYLGFFGKEFYWAGTLGALCCCILSSIMLPATSLLLLHCNNICIYRLVIFSFLLEEFWRGLLFCAFFFFSICGDLFLALPFAKFVCSLFCVCTGSIWAANVFILLLILCCVFSPPIYIYPLRSYFSFC